MVPDGTDHIVVAVPNLAAAEESFRTLLRLEVSGGGKHDGIGTENLIIPLRDCYLELATVVDWAQAEANPFGRLVSFALRNQLLFAGWAVALTAAAGAGMSHQRLTRTGVAVDLYGVAEVVGASDHPFGLVRPADQSRPGAGGLDAARLVGIYAMRPGSSEPVALSDSDVVVGQRNRTSGGYLSAVELESADGAPHVIDRRTLAAVWR